MYALIAAAALALVMQPPAAAPPAQTVQTVQPATTATALAGASRRLSRRERIALATPAGSVYDDAAERQIDLHVLMPVLGGDGGG